MSHTPPISERRGYALDDLSNATIAYIMVRGDAKTVVEALQGIICGAIDHDALGRKIDANRPQYIVYQVTGHPWSLFAASYDDSEKLPPLFAGKGFETLTFVHEDASGWSSVSCFQGDEEVEALHWGYDYSAELEEMEGAGDPNEIPEKYRDWDTHAKIVTDEEIGTSDVYHFRSKLRAVTESDLARGDAFVDELYKAHDAYLPRFGEMPWLWTNRVRSKKLPPEAFAGVHVLLTES